MSEFTKRLRDYAENGDNEPERMIDAADIIDEMEAALVKLEADYFERKIVMGNRVDIAEKEAFESARITLSRLWSL